MCLAAQQLHVFAHHDGLCPAFDQRAQIEMVSGQDHQIEAIGLVHHPVELRQRIMQIGDDETSHGMRASFAEKDLSIFLWLGRLATVPPS